MAERYRIGYAIAPKKEQSFIQKSLLEHAKQRGIDLDRIDISKPLIAQGSFDCIIHKLYGKEWKKQLEEFSAGNPDVAIIDPPDHIERLHNRITMLEVVTQLRIPPGNEDLGIPKQIVVYESGTLLGPGALGELRFPVVAKPVVADGSATSHQMYLVFSSDGLKKLSVPVVLQEFVNHGGVIFKVYVVGESVTCVKRNSLGDISEEKLKTLEGALSFSQVSNLTAQDRDDSRDSDKDRLNVEMAEKPPVGFIVDVANALREALGLQLFNFDVIKDARERSRYLVIDINYFPGYAKMPSYESVLTDFFLSIVQKKKLGRKNLNKEHDKVICGGATKE